MHVINLHFMCFLSSSGNYFNGSTCCTLEIHLVHLYMILARFMEEFSPSLKNLTIFLYRCRQLDLYTEYVTVPSVNYCNPLHTASICLDTTMVLSTGRPTHIFLSKRWHETWWKQRRVRQGKAHI